MAQIYACYGFELRTFTFYNFATWTIYLNITLFIYDILEPDNQVIKSKVVESERQVTLQGDVTVKMGKLLQGAIPYQQEYENLCYRSALQVCLSIVQLW